MHVSRTRDSKGPNRAAVSGGSIVIKLTTLTTEVFRTECQVFVKGIGEAKWPCRPTYTRRLYVIIFDSFVGENLNTLCLCCRPTWYLFHSYSVLCV